MTDPARPQPVLNWGLIASAASGLVTAFGAYLVFFGYTTDARVGAFAALTAKAVVAVGVLVTIAAPIVAALRARKQVTPKSAPQDDNGQPLMTAQEWIAQDTYGQHGGAELIQLTQEQVPPPVSSMTIADAPNVPQRRLGRLPNDPSKPRVRLTALEAPSLTYAPPASVDWHTNVPADSWGMDGNDRAGDCTFAELDHTVKADQVAAGNPEVKSTATEVLAAYSAVTGYDPSQTDAQGNNPTDQGAMMQDVRNYWRKHGITLGGTKHTILLFAEVDHTNHGLIKWCIARFGALGIGFNFPASAMSQFDAGQPWTVVAGSPIDGGHAVSAVGYDADYLYVVTWGRVQKMSWSFYDRYVDEAWTQLSEEFVSQTSGNDPLAETAHQLGEQYAAVTGQPNPIPAPSPAPSPSPSPTPTPVVLPADVIAWAKHVLTLKGQTHATIAVAKELLAIAGE